MSFNENLPRQLAELRLKYADLRFQKEEMTHECDCKFCTYEADYEDEDIEAIDREMKEIEATFVRVKRYAAEHHVDVSEPVIGRLQRELQLAKIAERSKL